MDTQTQVTIEEAGQQIVQLVRKLGGGVSFVDMKSLLIELGMPVEGNHFLHHPDNEHLILWGDMSNEFAEAVNAAKQNREVVLTPVDALIYVIDGEYLNLPIAKAKSMKTMLAYKTDHWQPMVFSLRSKIEAADAKKRSTKK